MGRGRSSDLRQPGRSIVVITTASLPWRTGTAVNPLLRTAYLGHILKDSKVCCLNLPARRLSAWETLSEGASGHKRAAVGDL